MLLNILLVILVIDCFALTGVILLQRSEGGALGMGGGPAGIFTARGAGDLLTRTTAILTVVFFSLSLIITLLAGHNKATSSVTERMKVNPIDLQALAKGNAPPASSSAPPAPPLPNGAPPLPNAVPAMPNAAVPQSAPNLPPRPGAARAPARASGVAATLPSVALPTVQGVHVPAPDLRTPPAQSAPAQSKPPASQ